MCSSTVTNEHTSADGISYRKKTMKQDWFYQIKKGPTKKKLYKTFSGQLVKNYPEPPADVCVWALPVIVNNLG